MPFKFDSWIPLPPGNGVGVGGEHRIGREGGDRHRAEHT